MQLLEAESMWPQSPAVQLHMAEVKIHQMDYMTALHILRQAYQHFSFTYSFNSESEVYEGSDYNIGANVVALMGMCEFRVSPESPEVRNNTMFYHSMRLLNLFSYTCNVYVCHV